VTKLGTIYYTSVALLLCNGDDEIFVVTDMPPPWPLTRGSMRLFFRAPKDRGFDYIETNFGRVPDRVVDTRILPD